MDTGRIELGQEGVAAASVSWEEVERELARAARDALEQKLGPTVDILGLRFMDADGREVSRLPRVLLIGFGHSATSVGPEVAQAGA